MYLEMRARQLGFGKFEIAAQPDVGRFPLRANDGARSALRAESALAFLPSGVVEVRLEPIECYAGGIVGTSSSAT